MIDTILLGLTIAVCAFVLIGVSLASGTMLYVGARDRDGFVFFGGTMFLVVLAFVTLGLAHRAGFV